MIGPTSPRWLLRSLATLLTMSLALGNTSCAGTIVMMTDYDKRSPAQYKWLAVDAAVVGSGVVVGSVLLAERNHIPGGVDSGTSVMAGAGIWALVALVMVGMMGMPNK